MLSKGFAQYAQPNPATEKRFLRQAIRSMNTERLSKMIAPPALGRQIRLQSEIGQVFDPASYGWS